MENEKVMELKFPSEIYDRAKAAKKKVGEYALTLMETTNPSLRTVCDSDEKYTAIFEAMKEDIQKMDTDCRIVIGLGRFNWKKTYWDFDAPKTRAVMQRMVNLEGKDLLSQDYLEVHLRCDELISETRNGFHRHNVEHHIYEGSYAMAQEVGNDDQ